MTKKERADRLYQLASKAIKVTIYKWIGRYGGDYDDLLSEANVHFMEALEKYDRKKGMKFRSWVSYKVTKGFLSTLRKKVEMSKHRKKIENAKDIYDCNPVMHETPEFDLKEFKRRLSKDARKIVNRTISPPAEIIISLAEYDDHRPPAVRKALREYFRDCGWKRDRIRAGFDEICEALENRDAI